MADDTTADPKADAGAASEVADSAQEQAQRAAQDAEANPEDASRKGEDGAGEPEGAPEPSTDARTLRIRLLERELAEREQTLHEYIRAHKKAQADLEAFRDRLKRDLDSEIEIGRARVVERLLDVHDNLARTVEAAQGGGSLESLRSGVELVARQFLQRMEEMGLVRVDPTGETFDPNSMEALSVVPVGDPSQDGKVVATVRPGFRLGERELRPASVVVGRRS
ncbi:MAG: nucleotide exchange factor GrpE [Deltaproteobacteria bacterium]|nr:nucleotide exchange factor GrpE [Deltaproteobacteria bacterium]MCB9785803.1 nucleotide exchange factor GrpE [Deltaproteobacteria bacterium]